MHTNHRRKNVCRAKHHGRRVAALTWSIYSRAPMRAAASRARRRGERVAIEMGSWDELPSSYPKTIDWFYW